ncbi:MAG: RluA family pseudouridine synthase [Bdellovibrionales bacterium]|nr:RluA family pseudouridine synthase [Bdellovibrionales bacterium]
MPESFFVPEGVSGRLDQVLLSLVQREGSELGITTRSQIKRFIQEGAVVVNDQIVAKAGYSVVAGDEIIVEEGKRSESELEPYEYPLSVIFQDEAILVLDKPHGLPVHPGAGTGNRTVLNAVLHEKWLSPSEFDAEGKCAVFRPGIVHRLDRDTTGVLVVAKSAAVLSELSRQFHDRTVEKVYMALALRKPRGGLAFDSNESGSIEAPIGRHPHERVRMAVVESGKPAQTDWELVERFRHSVLLRLQIHSGRTHQIRVHLAHIGSGVIGDSTYGQFDTLPKGAAERVSEFRRQALHAWRLSLHHPISGERMSFEAPIPRDFLDLVNDFRENNWDE